MVKLRNYTVAFIIGLFVIFIYYNGLNGGFLLDDPVNLINLKVFHRNPGLEGFFNYLLSVHSGFLKRPIPYATFLLNATNWPANPYWFKVTNLTIHLINGMLLYLATKQVLKISSISISLSNIKLIALFSALLWLLHPFHVSTVLYVFQRMAMVPLIFVLLGVIMYCKGREIYHSNNSKSLIYLYASVYLMTTFASLSKENGVMLPFYLYLLEILIVKHANIPPLQKKHKIMLFYLPIFVIVVALIYMGFRSYSAYEFRNFTMLERIFTEFRALVTYLYHLLFPSYFTEGVFTDGFVKSSSLMNPLSTLYSFLIILILLVVSYIARVKHPFLSFGLLFYFIGHIIESTFLPLELYFEHRNYIPSVFLFLAFSHVLIKIVSERKIFLIIPVALLLFFSFTTYLKASFWGDNLNLHLETARKYPESVRASTISAAMLSNKGADLAAIYILEKSVEKHQNIQLKANLISLKCHINKASDYDFEEFIKAIKNTEFESSDNLPFNNLITVLIKNKCMKYGSNTALRVLNSVEKNTGFKRLKLKSFTAYNYARLYALSNHPKKSVDALRSFIINSSALYQYNIVPYVSEVIEILIENNDCKNAMFAINLLDPIFNSTLYSRDIYNHKDRINYYKNKCKALMPTDN